MEGWLLRSSAGASRRGNSVWARRAVTDLPAAMAAVERFYAAVGSPPTFQISPAFAPAALRAALDRDGYVDAGPTDVAVADLTALRSALGRPASGQAETGPPRPSGRPDVGPALVGGPGLALVSRSRIHGDWLAAVSPVMSTFGTEQRVNTLAVLSRLVVPQLYVTLFVDGRPVAAGRGTLDAGWLGIYSMATLPEARGRGAATAVLGQLADWAAEAGATRAYLQVEEKSGPARRLYAGLGFRPVYRYSYRRRAV
ncbi:MAG: GNAT family N-acetyltransferase [Frankia sp.]